MYRREKSGVLLSQSQFDCRHRQAGMQAALKVPLSPRHQRHLAVWELLEKVPCFRAAHALHRLVVDAQQLITLHQGALFVNWTACK